MKNEFHIFVCVCVIRMIVDVFCCVMGPRAWAYNSFMQAREAHVRKYVRFDHFSFDGPSFDFGGNSDSISAV